MKEFEDLYQQHIDAVNRLLKKEKYRLNGWKARKTDLKQSLNNVSDDYIKQDLVSQMEKANDNFKEVSENIKALEESIKLLKKMKANRRLDYKELSYKMLQKDIIEDEDWEV